MANTSKLVQAAKNIIGTPGSTGGVAAAAVAVAKPTSKAPVPSGKNDIGSKPIVKPPRGKSPDLPDASGCVTPPIPNTPGAVINKPNNNSDLYIDNDPDDFYFDLVFQKQSYLEKLRAKFEGKMIILAWPKPYNAYNVGGFDLDTDDLLTNDKIFWVRMMINGFWKQVVDTKVFRTYAALNGYDIGKLSVSDDEALTDIEKWKLLYGEKGLINLLVEAGGITVLADDGINSPVWNDFAHIVEADRLDFCEYKEYLDHYNNGGAPFEIEILKPYEPAGSIAYYLPTRLMSLSEQVQLQSELSALRRQIEEQWPKLAARVEQVAAIIESLSTSYVSRLNDRLLSDSELFKIFVCKDGWSLRVNTTNKREKSRETFKNLFAILLHHDELIDNAFPYVREGEDPKTKLVNDITAVQNRVSDSSDVVAERASIDAAVQNVTSTARSIGVAAASMFSNIRSSTGLQFANPDQSLNFAKPQEFQGKPLPAAPEPEPDTRPILSSTLDSVISNGSATYVPSTVIGKRLIINQPAENLSLSGFVFPKYVNNELMLSSIASDSYITTMVMNRIKDRIESKDLINRARLADQIVKELLDDVQKTRNFISTIDEELQLAEDIDSYKSIFDKMSALRDDLNDMLEQDVEFCNNVYKDIDYIFTSHLELIYNSIQEFRRRVYQCDPDINTISIQDKLTNLAVSPLNAMSERYRIIWPKSVMDILNKYIPGKVNFSTYT